MSTKSASQVLLLFILTLIAGGLTAAAFATLPPGRALIVFAGFWFIFLLVAIRIRLG
jgi:hypothetical protein